MCLLLVLSCTYLCHAGTKAGCKAGHNVDMKVLSVAYNFFVQEEDKWTAEISDSGREYKVGPPAAP